MSQMRAARIGYVWRADVDSAAGALSSRGTTEQKFKKLYLDEKYSIEELEAKFSQWDGLLRQLFMRKR